MSENLLTFSTLELFLAGTTGILFFIQVYYCLVVYARPLRAARTTGSTERTTANRAPRPVSVIVYAHGDPEELRRNLPALLNQDYPEYEVIVTNDRSDIESKNVLEQLSTEYRHLHYTDIPADTRYMSHKKLALTMGIKAAKHDILLFTETDCTPISPKWITTMAGTYDRETEIVLGFCTYRHTDGFFQKLIAYDNLMNGLQMLSSALTHHPYTGNGQNLSYRRQLFFARKGFSKSLYLHAGSDDLFINEAANDTNTQVQYSPDALTETCKIEDPSIWKQTKISHAATGRYYKGNALLFYRMDNYSNLLFLLTAFAAFIVGIPGNWLVSILAGSLLTLRFTAKAAVLRKSALLLQQKPQTAWLPVLEIAQPAYDLHVHIYRLFKWRNDFTTKI